MDGYQGWYLDDAKDFAKDLKHNALIEKALGNEQNYIDLTDAANYILQQEGIIQHLEEECAALRKQFNVISD